MSNDIGVESSLWLRTRRSVGIALRKDGSLLLTEGEIGRIASLLVDTDGGVWRQVVAEYEALLHDARAALGKRDLELEKAEARIEQLESERAECKAKRRWRWSR